MRRFPALRKAERVGGATGLGSCKMSKLTSVLLKLGNVHYRAWIEESKGKGWLANINAALEITNPVKKAGALLFDIKIIRLFVMMPDDPAGPTVSEYSMFYINKDLLRLMIIDGIFPLVAKQMGEGVPLQMETNFEKIPFDANGHININQVFQRALIVRG